MARVLVAGATGYLGRFVSRELKARGHFVRALARAPEKLAELRDALDEIVTREVTQPATLTWHEVAALAFQVQGKPVKITKVPLWIMAVVNFLTRRFSKHSAELMAFFTTMGSPDVVGPPTGTRTLDAHYQNLAADAQGEGSS